MTLAEVQVGDPHTAAHNEEREAINDLLTSLAAEAALARNAGNLSAGTVPDARLSAAIARQADVTAQIATEVSAAIDAVIAGAPGALDTLFEISEALADDADEIAALVASIAAEAALARNADNLTSGTVADARIASTIARDSEVTAAVAAEAALARNGDNITSGTVAEARIASSIARDTEVTAAISASEAGQVRDGDAAGGVLSGAYPNPGFAVDMATQAELDALAGAINQMTDERIPISIGQETYPRALAVAGGTAISTGQVHLTYFTAYADGTVTALKAYSGNAGWSGATPTTCKMGLFSVNTSTGDLTRIGITANDTTLFSTATTGYQKALLASCAVTKGLRYAFAVFVDSTGTMPQLCMALPTPAPSFAYTGKRLHGRQVSQTDISATILDSALSPSGANRVYGELIY